MRVDIRYGKKGFGLDLPDDIEATVIHKVAMPRLADEGAGVASALRSPVGCRPLRDEAKGKSRVCILICDVTRPVPNGLVLPVILEELIGAGVSLEAVTVLVATGLHRPNEGQELREVVGSDWVLGSVRVENHFARNDAGHVLLGTTPGGMPIKFDRRFVDADLRIVVGLVEPHFMAGYSGGRKVIIPGVAHEDTIRVLHSTRMLYHDMVANSVLDGNPVHEEQIRAVRMVGQSFAVNTVIDEERHLSIVNFGALEESHRAICALARPYFEISMPRRFATVVTSGAGYPLDRNYYQTVKGMVGVTGICEPGSDIFILSECSEGLGTSEYAEAQTRFVEVGADAFLQESMLKPTAPIDEWETIMQIKAMKAGCLHLFSEGLSGAEKALTGIDIVDSPSDAVARCLAGKRDRSVAIVPEGPYVIPVHVPGKR